MRIVLIGALTCALALYPKQTKADLFGGDVAVLAQILVNAVQQLAQLKQILNQSKDTLGLLEDINRGINDSLNLMETHGLIREAGVYREWKVVQQALREIGALYGNAVPSRDQQVQLDTDQSVAEAIALNNSMYDYTKEIDRLGETIKSYSHSVSPGGAQKLTAQSMGVLLHVMNQSLRLQATGMKLQAQALAVQNKKEKAETESFLKHSSALSAELKKKKDVYKTPRFE